jgi:hypothetical protein
MLNLKIKRYFKKRKVALHEELNIFFWSIHLSFEKVIGYWLLHIAGRWSVMTVDLSTSYKFILVMG